MRVEAGVRRLACGGGWRVEGARSEERGARGEVPRDQKVGPSGAMESVGRETYLTPLSPTRCLSARSKWPWLVISRGARAACAACAACAAQCGGGRACACRGRGEGCVEGVREEGGWGVGQAAGSLSEVVSSVEVRVN